MKNVRETQRRAQDGMARVQNGQSGEYIPVVMNALDKVIASVDTFTADDVWSSLGEDMMRRIPRPAIIGPVLASYARQGKIVCIGFVPSTRPATHGRPVRQWSVTR